MKKFSFLLLLLANIMGFQIFAGNINETEPNNSIATKNTVTPTFVEDESNDTIFASLQAEKDTDFIALSLPAGYNYNVYARALDSYTMSDTTYKADVKFMYKIGNGEWSSAYDSYVYDILSPASTIIYFKVCGYYSSAIGKYGLSFSTERSTSNYLNVENSYIYLSSLKNDTAVSITCTGGWTASSSQTWLVLGSTSGTGNNKIAFSVQPNATTVQRTAKITISSGTVSESVTVYQDPYVSPDSYEPNDTVTKASLLTATFVNDKAIVTTQNANIHVRDNYDYYKLKFQTGYNYLIKTKIYDTYNAKGTSEYTGNASFGIKDYNDYYFSWNDAFICKDTNSVFVQIYPDAVGTYELEQTIERFTGEILQAEFSSYNVLKSGLSYSKYIDVYSTTNWNVSVNQTWVTLNSTTGSGISSFGFKVNANTTGASRTATITLSATGATSVAITVYQEGNLVADSYEPNNTEATAYSIPLAFIDNMATFATSKASIHNSTDVDYYKISLPVGSRYLIASKLLDGYSSTYGLDAKYSKKLDTEEWSSTYDSRISPFVVENGGTLYFKAQSYYTSDTGTYELEINVEKIIPSLGVSEDTIIISSSAAAIATFDISSNVSWTVVSSNQTWCTIDPTSGSNNKTISVSVSENTAASRTATITVSSNGMASKTITVIQNGTTTSNLTVLNTAFVVAPNASNNATFAITSNISWTITSDQTWCTVNPASGSNDGTVTISVEENTGTAARNATITISGNNVTSKTIAVTQNGITDGIESASNNNGLSIYPSPSNGNITVSLDQSFENGTIVSVVDLNGKTVYTKTLNKADGNVLQMSLNLPSNIYLLNISNSRISKTERITIIK